MAAIYRLEGMATREDRQRVLLLLRRDENWGSCVLEYVGMPVNKIIDSIVPREHGRVQDTLNVLLNMGLVSTNHPVTSAKGLKRYWLTDSGRVAAERLELHLESI